MVTMKTGNLGGNGEGRMGLTSPKSHPQEIVTIQSVCKLPRKDPFSGLVFILYDSELSLCKQLYSRALFGAQSMATSSPLPEARIPVGNKRPTKTLKGKTRE